MKTRKSHRHIDGDIQEEIEIHAQSWGPAQIHRYLEKKFKDDLARIPSRKTVERIANEVLVPDTSGEWSIADNEGEDARVVLDILAHILSTDSLIQLSSKRGFTKKEAQWIIRLREAAPDAPAKVIWLLAQLYIRREWKGITDNKDLDHYLAFTPWKGRNFYRLYKRVVAKGWVPKVPLWPSLVDAITPVGPEDPRFTGNENDVKEFEQDICQRKERGESFDNIADIYNIDPEDVKDIILKKET